MHTAADNCGTTRKTRYTYHGADSGARYRQSQNDSDSNSDNNAHEQRLKLGSCIYKITEPVHHICDGMTDKPGNYVARMQE